MVWRALLEREQLGSPEQQLRRAASHSTALVERMQLQRSLKGHDGCVNTCSFTPNGDSLLSGSDDLAVIMWDWEAGTQRLRYMSGHRNNVFQAKALPGSNDSTIVTCAADGQVRVGLLPQGGGPPQTLRLALHDGRAHKLALDPLSPWHCFYSCGEDGEIKHFDLRAGERSGARSTSRLLVARGINERGSVGHRAVELNAVHVNPARPWQIAVGGGDAWVRVYDCRQVHTASSDTAATGPSTSAAGSSRAGRGSRGGSSGSSGRVFQMSDAPVAKLCPGPLRRPGQTHVTCVVWSKQGELLATYNDDDIYLFDAPSAAGAASVSTTRDSGKRKYSRTVAPAGDAMDEQQEEQEEEEEEDEDEGNWQRRQGSQGTSTSAPGASDTSDGVVRRFSGHRNARTVKGVSFMGDDNDFVVSGSDDGHIYIWNRHTGVLHQWLEGDTHTVNCLEPHPFLPMTLATSGIDDDVKLWAPTAEEPQPLPPECAEQMAANRAGRGRRVATNMQQIFLTPEMLLRLFAGERRAARQPPRRRQQQQQDEDARTAAAGAAGTARMAGARTAGAAGPAAGRGREQGEEENGEQGPVGARLVDEQTSAAERLHELVMQTLIRDLDGREEEEEDEDEAEEDGTDDDDDDDDADGDGDGAGDDGGAGEQRRRRRQRWQEEEEEEEDEGDENDEESDADEDDGSGRGRGLGGGDTRTRRAVLTAGRRPPCVQS